MKTFSEGGGRLNESIIRRNKLGLEFINEVVTMLPTTSSFEVAQNLSGTVSDPMIVVKNNFEVYYNKTIL
jgi:hypothetical protein